MTRPKKNTANLQLILRKFDREGFQSIVVSRSIPGGTELCGVRDMGFGRYLYIESVSRRKNADASVVAPLIHFLDVAANQAFGLDIRRGCAFSRRNRLIFLKRMLAGRINRRGASVFFAKTPRKG